MQRGGCSTAKSCLAFTFMLQLVLITPAIILGHAGIYVRFPDIIEVDRMEISAIAGDTLKLERITACCAASPDGAVFALHYLLRSQDRK